MKVKIICSGRPAVLYTLSFGTDNSSIESIKNVSPVIRGKFFV